MIFEQAFQYLPEILSGKSYPSQEYEGGVVAAFSMAVLQELNARNAANPLSLIQCESLYRSKRNDSWPSLKKEKGPRYLRADLCVSLHTMRQGNPSLSAYGWRHSNWLEAKFFRAYNAQTGLPKANSNQSVHTGSLLADIYRLVALCPRGVPKKIQDDKKQQNRSNIGRYLLHVYSGTVDQHLSLALKGGKKRAWIEKITTPGQHFLKDFSLAEEPTSVRSHVGSGLTDLHLDFECTNFSIKPAERSPQSVTYTCILTRFDSFKITKDKDYWGLNADRSITCSDDADVRIHKQLSEFVAARIELKPEIEKRKPSPPEFNASNDAEENADA